MPALSFHLPRFLCAHRSQRSHSPKPPPDALEQDAHAATGTSRSPAPISLTHLDRARGDSSGHPSQDPPPITQTDIDHSISTSELTPQNLVTRPPVHLPHLPESSDSAQHSSCSLVTPLQQSSGLEWQSQPSGKVLPNPQHQNQGMFHQAHNLCATGNFIDGNVGNVSLTNNFGNSNTLMKDFLKETIPGAAADSSTRDPPPRCHPGTRLAILERCLYFIVHCNGVKKMRWVVGAAGVGKSAVMQNVAESRQMLVISNASVFFSINGRNDGTKAVTTFSYQLATKSKLYRRLIGDEITNDPSLLQSSMSAQFEKFVVQPFIYNPELNAAGRVLIIIDGLDECKNADNQVELLRLISNFCTSYPSSPIAWLIASRPEPHIVSFFSSREVTPAYEKEEITVDSNEAQADVERFIREKLTEIGKASDFLGPQWPDEPDLWKLAKAAGGLFAYAHTVIRYIGDSTVGDPVSQLSDVLNVINELPLSDVPREQHPMALLDALYTRILSKVPPKIMINVRKLLLLLASDWDSALSLSSEKDFIVMCNWLGMTANETYAAVNRLRSVLYFPQRHEAHNTAPKPFHKSLIDYTSRSGFFSDIKLEAQQLKAQCAFRVLKEAPGGIDLDNVNYAFYHGVLARNGSASDKISITWRTDEGIGWNDDKTQSSMYKLAIGEVAAGMKRGDPVFQSDSCIKLLTTQFRSYYTGLPYHELCDFVFDKSRRPQLMKLGVLKQIPTKVINTSYISSYFSSKLRFHRPVAKATLPDPWIPSCNHEREGQWEQGKEQHWTTVFNPRRCSFCRERFNRQLEIWITRHPDHAVLIMFPSAEESCIEFRFVDPEDNVSEWTYWLWLWLSSSGLKELATAI